MLLNRCFNNIMKNIEMSLIDRNRHDWQIFLFQFLLAQLKNKRLN